MKLKPLDPAWKVEQPLRAFGRIVAALSILFGVCAPFTNVPAGGWIFFLTGIGYSVGLAFLCVGISVLPPPIRRRAFIGIMSFLGFSLLAMWLIWGIASSGLPISSIDLILSFVIWISAIGLMTIAALACYGWWCHANSAIQTSNSPDDK